MYNTYLFIDLCIYVFIFFEAAPIRSGPPGVDAVVSRPHGGHHRNASTEELDHQVVGGRVLAIEDIVAS